MVLGGNGRSGRGPLARFAFGGCCRPRARGSGCRTGRRCGVDAGKLVAQGMRRPVRILEEERKEKIGLRLRPIAATIRPAPRQQTPTATGRRRSGAAGDADNRTVVSDVIFPGATLARGAMEKGVGPCWATRPTRRYSLASVPAQPANARQRGMEAAGPYRTREVRIQGERPWPSTPR